MVLPDGLKTPVPEDDTNLGLIKTGCNFIWYTKGRCFGKPGVQKVYADKAAVNKR
jgi:hypothetical protein